MEAARLPLDRPGTRPEVAWPRGGLLGLPQAAAGARGGAGRHVRTQSGTGRTDRPNPRTSIGSLALGCPASTGRAPNAGGREPRQLGVLQVRSGTSLAGSADDGAPLHEPDRGRGRGLRPAGVPSLRGGSARSTATASAAPASFRPLRPIVAGRSGSLPRVGSGGDDVIGIAPRPGRGTGSGVHLPPPGRAQASRHLSSPRSGSNCEPSSCPRRVCEGSTPSRTVSDSLLPRPSAGPSRIVGGRTGQRGWADSRRQPRSGRSPVGRSDRHHRRTDRPSRTGGPRRSPASLRDSFGSTPRLWVVGRT